MQLLTFKIFCDLVETGSFSRSAEINNITQSAVSQQIRGLEEKYNVMFFERGGKKFSITPEGLIFERAARAILDTYTGIDSRLNDMQSTVSGPLRISTVYSIGLHELPAPLEKFRNAHPSVNVLIDYKRAPQVYEDVLADRADFGLVPFPMRERGIIAEVFDQDELVIICSPLHKLAKKKRTRLKDLQGESFVAFEPDTATRRSIDRALRQQGVTFNHQHEFDTIETVKRAVEVAGVVSIVPRRTVEKEVSLGRLLALSIQDRHMHRPLGIVRKQGNITTTAMREMMTLLKKHGHPALEAAECA